MARRPCRTYHFYSNGFFHQRIPVRELLSSTDNPRYHNTDDLITDFLLRIAKRLPLKHATTWLYTAYMMAQHECKFGIGRIPQVSDAPIV